MTPKAAPLRAVVTGAAGGIGAAIVAALRARGDDVVGIDRDRRASDDRLVIADLAAASARADAIEEATTLLGGVDVLVNAAGVFAETGLLESTPSDWQPVWEVDMIAPIDLMRLVSPGMVARGFGRIVNVTSVHAVRGQDRCLAYDVAKAGLEAATRSAAIELGVHGILVNAVAPGFVRTRMSTLPDGTDETESAGFRTVYVDAGKLPLRRGAAAAEIAPAVAFLTSRENSYTTGSVLTVDGGLVATF